jgi:peptide chain release factor subunit 3
MKGLERKLKAPFMMPVSGKYKDMGVVVEGKIESGIIKKGGALLMMPGRTPVEVVAIYSESEEELPNASCGDQVRMRVRGVEEEDVVPGFVLTSKRNPINCVSAFEAQIHIIELKSILTAGFTCVMHVHTTVQEVTFAALLHKLEKGTGRKSKKPPAFASKGTPLPLPILGALTNTEQAKPSLRASKPSVWYPSRRMRTTSSWDGSHCVTKARRLRSGR